MGSLSKIRAEYIWIDGSRPTREVRSKTRIIEKSTKPDLWSFDGSSTNQADSKESDVVLRPVYECPDPIRGGDNKLVLCETCLPDGAGGLVPHKSNTRALAVDAFKRFGKHEPWLGMEQEYTLLCVKTGWPAGFPAGGYPEPQGPYYCGVGALKIHGRDLIEEHTVACLEAGLDISGTNAEVMPGQWEFQIGPVDTIAIGDQVWLARYLLFRLAERHNVEVSIEPKPIKKGEWNGAGMHCNFSTTTMRENYEAIVLACEALKNKKDQHIEAYGDGIQDRLTGKHETQDYRTFTWGVSDRGASIRIPWKVATDKKGYIEDRRPNANADPYQVAAIITNTVCEALETANLVSYSEATNTADS